MLTFKISRKGNVAEVSPGQGGHRKAGVQAGHEDRTMLLSLVAPLCVLLLLSYAFDPVRPDACRLPSRCLARSRLRHAGVPQVFAFNIAVWTALTACFLLLVARVWLWRVLPRVQKVRTGRDPALRWRVAQRYAARAAAYGTKRPCAATWQGTIAFFHPFADGGGGGERVLWCVTLLSVQCQPPTPGVQRLSRASRPMQQLLIACACHPCRAAVAAVQQAYPQRSVVLYTGDSLTAAQLADRARQKFALDIKPKFQVASNPTYPIVSPHSTHSSYVLR